MLHPHTPGSLDMGGQDQLVVVSGQGQAGCPWGTHLRGEELMPHSMFGPVQADCMLVEGRQGQEVGLKAQVLVLVEDRLDSEELKVHLKVVLSMERRLGLEQWAGELMPQLCLVGQLVLEVGRLGLGFQEVELKLEGGMRNPEEGELLQAQCKEEGGLEAVMTQKGSSQQHSRREGAL